MNWILSKLALRIGRHGDQRGSVDLTLDHDDLRQLAQPTPTLAEDLLNKHFGPAPDVLAEYHEARARQATMEAELSDCTLNLAQLGLDRQRALADKSLAGKDLAARLAELDSAQQKNQSEKQQLERGLSLFEGHVSEARNRAKQLLDQQADLAANTAAEQIQEQRRKVAAKLTSRIAADLDLALHLEQQQDALSTLRLRRALVAKLLESSTTAGQQASDSPATA